MLLTENFQVRKEFSQCLNELYNPDHVNVGNLIAYKKISHQGSQTYDILIGGPSFTLKVIIDKIRSLSGRIDFEIVTERNGITHYSSLNDPLASKGAKSIQKIENVKYDSDVNVVHMDTEHGEYTMISFKNETFRKIFKESVRNDLDQKNKTSQVLHFKKAAL